jgi:DNA-directed RNA polymerase specialized sigma subunit
MQLKEKSMQYKTMVLELLRERTELYEQLRLKRKVLPTLEILARELKASHEKWQQALSAAKPNSQPNQIASEALELALKELTDRLPIASPPDEAEPLSLEAAMAFIQNPTSSA